MSKKPKIDYQLLIIILALLGFGLAALYSASTVESFENFGTTTRYIFNQLTYGVGLGLAVLVIVSKIDYHQWRKFLPLMILVSLVLLALVKVPSVSFSSGGATRWIHFGPVFFQPAELAKLVLVFYLAAWAAKKRQEKSGFVFNLLPTLIILGLFAGLILWQPDFSTMIIILGTAIIMLFSSGLSLKHFVWLGASGLLALALLIKVEPYRYERLLSFLNPAFDPQGSSYQINQALLGIGGGGLWGYGYGLSRQKYSYLPEPMGDSVFAITAEELGFIRILLMLLLFVLLFLKGRQIAKNAPDTYGKMIALGVTTWISLQALVNISSMIGLMPLTGVPLPFFSYGSSAMLITLAALGVLLNISRQAK